MGDSIKIDCHVPIPMRDGVTLRADVYRPDDAARHPVLLARLPYSKDLSPISLSLLSPIRAARRDYVVVIQDTRGRFKSDGQFSLFSGEAEDGFDTVAWCAAQPWSDGNVGMYGASYFGATQWLTATAAPPALKVIAPTITSSDYYEGWTYQGGAFQQGFIQFWTAGMATETITRLTDGPAEARKKLYGSIFGMEKTYRSLPLADFPPATVPGLMDHYRAWLKHPSLDEFWEQVRSDSKYPQRGKSARAREQQRLIVGPWLHGLFNRIVGDVDFGPGALPDAIDLGGLHLDWFDRCFRNAPDNGAPVRLFVMGPNVWRNEDEWPLARAVATKFYLASDGRANSLRGNGRLLKQAPTREASDVFLYDPEQPVPTCGGCTLMPGAQSAGPQDQRLVEERDDVLVYTSEPLTDPLEVTGPVEAFVHAATDGLDTDFTAKLTAVAPDGRSLNLCDGILRARYRNSLSRAELLEPDRVYTYRIQLGSTSYVFAPGYRMRLQISSSNFPRFDRNLNTGGDIATEQRGRVAVQRVFHGGVQASHLLLPVVPHA
jgi:predicted acyl esterase